LGEFYLYGFFLSLIQSNIAQQYIAPGIHWIEGWSGETNIDVARN
jgi:hypothetical protein